MRKEEQVEDLFFHLNPLFSFIDYGLVEHFIKKFGSDSLKVDMQSYCRDMQTFMKQTTIKQLIDFLPGKQEAPQNFTILKAKIGENASTCTLDTVNTLRRRFCAELQLSEVVFCLIALEDSNSFIISLAVPSVLVPDLIESFKEIKQNFFGVKCITSLSLGSRWLYNQKLTSFGFQLKKQYQQFQGLPSPIEWIPSPTKKIFRLAMIETEGMKQGHNDIKDRFVQMTITGRVDDILHAKSPILVENILKSTLHGSEIILMEGAPGSDKSTLTVHICQRWGKGEIFLQFTAVILVQLRDPAVQRAQTIADLLPVENVAVAQDLATELIATNGRGILWILDGWDELPPYLQQNSIFSNLLQHSMDCEERLLHECSIIITSRSISSGDLHPVVTSRIEVLGFTPEEQRQYFIECLKGDTNALKALLEKIQENTMVQNICYLPLNAAFVVHTFKYKSQSIPNTEYEIYLSVILSCIQRHFEREDRGQDLPRELTSFSDLFRSEAVREHFRCLCELAYHGVMENKVTFSSGDLPQGSNTLSLLRAIKSLFQSRRSVFYTFLHLSIQEVLSAYYIATWLPDSEQVSKFHQLFNHPRFTAVFQFYAAVTKLKSPGMHQVITRIVEAKSEPLLVSLLRCLYEAQDPSLCLCLAKRLKYSLDLGGTVLSSLDCLSISFFLSFIGGRVIDVKLFQCYIGELSAKCLAKYLSGDMNHAGQVTINLNSNEIHGEDASHICRMLYFIDHLFLCYNPLQDTGVSLISESLKENVKTLMLYKCGVSSRGAEDLSRALAQNSSLMKLDIGNNYIGDKGISYMAEALKQNEHLKELWIGECGMTDKGAAFLASALGVNNSLKMLYIGGSKGALTDNGLSAITQSLVNKSQFIKLAVPHNFDPLIIVCLRQEVTESRKRNGLPPIGIEGEY